jgi:lipopolysaccharide export system protein LptA
MTGAGMKPLILSALLAAGALAPAAHAQVGRGDQPIRITSELTEYLQKEGRTVWRGNVIATQGESRINADRLTMICTSTTAQPDGQQSCDDIEELIAEGNVLYTTDVCTKIKGDKATYNYPTDTITITGDVISSQCDEVVVRGTQIVYDIGNGAVRYTAGNERVLSIFTPKKRDPAATPGAPAPGTPAPATPPANRPN